MGGRANWNGTNGDEGASRRPTGGGINNFQGRYIIRHYWDKPVACKQPAYDKWGGPPGNPDARPTPTAAKGLATAPRGKVVLKAEVRSPVPLLGIAGKPPQRRRARAMTARSRAARWVWGVSAAMVVGGRRADRARLGAVARAPCPASSRTTATSASRWASRRGRATTRSPPRSRATGSTRARPSAAATASAVTATSPRSGRRPRTGSRRSTTPTTASPPTRSARRRARSRRASAATATSRSWSRPARWIARSSAARAPRRRASPAWSAIRSPTSIARATAATRPTCARCRPPRACTARGCGRR